MKAKFQNRALVAAVATLCGITTTFCSSGTAAPTPSCGGPIAFAADGKPPTDNKEPEGDPVPLDKLPKAVVNAVKKALPGARIVKAAKLADGNYFLDDVKVGKKEFDVTVTPEGKILKSDEMKEKD